VFPGRLFLTKFDKSAGTRGPWIFYIEPDVTADSVYLVRFLAAFSGEGPYTLPGHSTTWLRVPIRMTS